MSDSPSTPPAHERSKTARLSLVLGTFTDWFVCALLGGGIYVGTLPVEPWAYVLVAVGAPSALGSMLQKLGKGPGGGSATAILFAIANKVGVAGLVKKSLLGVVALLTVGCGASVYSSTLDVINTTAATVTQAQPAVLALCQVDPGERCDDARKAYEVAGSAVAAAHDALEAYRVTGEGLDAVADAVRVAARSAREVARVAAK